MLGIATALTTRDFPVRGFLADSDTGGYFRNFRTKRKSTVSYFVNNMITALKYDNRFVIY